MGEGRVLGVDPEPRTFYIGVRKIPQPTILRRSSARLAEPTFLFHHPVEVRFKDIDVGGHAHHSHALVYFEEGRSAYWREIVGRPGIDDIDYILAGARIRYHRRVLWPQRLDVAVRVARLGRSHFDMEYEVRADDGELLVSGETTQVMYDYARGRAVRVPGKVAQAVERLEGPLPRERSWADAEEG